MPRSDPFLPVAPAQVKVLVLPVGPMHCDRFAAFLDRLNSERAIRLRDVSADSRPNRTMFSPLAFPDGAIFYDLVTHVPQPSHLALSPFDLYREPLVVLALADGAVLSTVDYGGKRTSNTARSVEERNVRALYQELEALRDTYTKALVHRVLIFDYETSPDAPLHMPDEGMATIARADDSNPNRTTVKTAMADIASLLLAEMNTLARSFDALSYIESPGQSSAAGFRGYGKGESADDGAVSAASSRRNSQFALPTRSGSVSSAMTAVDRAQVRMSMPVPFKAGSPFGAGSSASVPGRPSTPVRPGSMSGPATIPEDGGDPISTPSHSSTAMDTAESIRNAIQDRVSVLGFGSGGLNERWRNKGKSRVTIVVASLYLQAGRWTDALRELIDGATGSRSINDHLWHGKALELIVVCLLLLAWAGIEFQVPTVCLPPPEKGSAAQQAALALEAAAEKAHPEQPKWLRNLQLLLPDLLDRILGLYSRISSEHLPPLPLAEATIRFSNMLAALHMADGTLDHTFLGMIIEGNTAGVPALTTSPRLTVAPSRTYIASMLFRAFPSASSTAEVLTTIDRIVILSGIATVLGRLGFQRKKAMVVRELMSVLIGGLVEARTRGAAEVGIHPAAGLMSQNGIGAHAGHTNGAAALDLAEGDIESGVDAFLGMLLRTYGVVELTPSLPPSDGNGDVVIDDTDEAIVARIREQATVRLFGLPGTKFNLLRACINFCEALPDFAGVLKYSSDLLRTGGSGIAPGATRGDAAPVIGRDEQVRLVTNIAKTSNLSRRLGFGAIAAEYWDEFLLRGVKLEAAPAACKAVAHSKTELPGKAVAARTSQDVDPFIHNSFIKPSEKAIVEQILVADEPATFRLTLQNPYDIEVEIESVRIETDGVDFEAFADTTVLGPFRTQIVKVSGVPRAAGALRITGAVVRVRGCRERRFPIFTQPWSPERPDRIKNIGQAPFLVAVAGNEVKKSEKKINEKKKSEKGESEEMSEKEKPEKKKTDEKRNSRLVTPVQLACGAPIKPDQLLLNVIPAQPMVVVESTTLPQSSVMVLEGERQVFSVTLKNLSTTTPVDFILFSFQDSTQESVQTALANRNATPAELYEYELVLAKRQALRLRTTGGAPRRRYIDAGATAAFEFEILGKPGLTSGTIQVDYAHLGVPADELASSTFYTRQASLHLTVTVNASVEIARMDVLPLHGHIPESLWARCGDATTVITPARLRPDRYCLLLLDLRNAWPSQMRVELMADDSDADGVTDADTTGGIKVTEHILPGNTARVIVPLRRIYLDDPHASIPALNPSRQRQFVVSTSKITPDMERANREAFWYRERILDRLRGRWSTEGAQGVVKMADTSATARRGSIELRSMRLTPRMIEAIKVDEVGIDVWMQPAAPKRKKSRVVKVDSFVEMCVRITNRTAAPLYPTLRLMPALCHRPLNVALDYTRKFAWNGALQQTLPLLAARSSTEVRLGVTALCRGEFEVTASVEETRLWTAPASEDDAGKDKNNADEATTTATGRPRSNTETMLLDALLGPRERRIWHSRKACHFVVV